MKRIPLKDLGCLIFLLLLVMFCRPARCEPTALVISDELQLGLAESFMAEGEYYRAITEYKKFLYFFPDSEKCDYVRLQIGMAYYHGGEFQQAIEAFEKVRQKGISKYFAAAAFYEGVCHSKLGDPAAANDDFERVLALDPPPPLAPDALAGLSLSALDNQDLEASRRALERLYGEFPASPLASAAMKALPLMEEAENRPRKSPFLAGALSTILPGSGYAYADRYRDGLMAFLVNGLFIAGTTVAIDHENYPVAVLIGGAGLPFYFGNIFGATKAAKQWNLSITRELRNELAIRLNYHF